jgi:beta-galactosidase/beta-glucuronidase
MNRIPRPEHPRPQFVRSQWLCLNGPWQFEIDTADDGLTRGLCERDLARTILVPFCPESSLSGIGCTDFMNAVWYRRTVTVPREWAGRRVLLHFQAADYETTVWAGGVEVGRHVGGFTPFTCDLGDVARPGEALTIVVRARDDHRQLKAKGKQCAERENKGCFYTRTTGIWQTVWLEAVPRECRLERPRIWPDVAGSRFIVEQPLTWACGKQTHASVGMAPGSAGQTRGSAPTTATASAGPFDQLRAGSGGGLYNNGARGLKVRATLRDAEGPVASAECPADADFTPRLVLSIPAARRRLWSIDDPHLYGLELELLDERGATVDVAESYAGLRSVGFKGPAFQLNGRTVFQRLVLDQGYWPDGIMTAPSDEALRRDIELSMAAGFNGARLHQKVFEERFLYHADRLGYLVWGEFADWGCRDETAKSFDDHQRPGPAYVAEWVDAVRRDLSHPAIVGWCPLNETFQTLGDRATVLDEVTVAMFAATKAVDPTRPVLDASGYAHRVPTADVYDAHDYDQNPATFRARHDGLLRGEPFVNAGREGEPWSVPWRGQPYFVSEFGGIWWNAELAAQAADGRNRTASWGYGQRVRTLEEFYERFDGLCRVLLGNPRMFGYCYTQLTDVFQEQNGVYAFDRTEKFDASRLRAVQQTRAAIEPW